MGNDKRKKVITLRETQTFVAYSNEHNRSLLINLEEDKIIPYPQNTAKLREIYGICRNANMPTTILFQDVDHGPVYLTLETCNEIICVVDWKDDQIAIEKCSNTLDDEASKEDMER